MGDTNTLYIEYTDPQSAKIPVLDKNPDGTENPDRVLGYKNKVTRVDLSTLIDLEKDIWTTQSKVRVIGLNGLKKIADKLGIVEKDFQMIILPSADNKQQHGVNIWLGFRGDNDKDNWRRGSGEASVLNTGEVLSVKKVDEAGNVLKNNEGAIVMQRVYAETKVDAQYRLAMAEKRAFSRALLGLIRLYGFYSEAEASDFANPSKDAKESFDY